jgi:hypothetical protein
MSTPASDAPAGALASSAAEGKPRCRCGYDRDHYMVSPEAKHTFWGWVLITLGISSKPIYMSFRCRRCGVVIEGTDDPHIIHNYRV